MATNHVQTLGAAVLIGAPGQFVTLQHWDRLAGML